MVTSNRPPQLAACFWNQRCTGPPRSESLAISIPRAEAAAIGHFQAQMPYGLFVPDVKPDADP